MKKYFILLAFIIAPLPLDAQSYSSDVRNFLSTVYKNHPTLISERLKRQQSQLGITEAEGLYDPLMTARITRQKDAAAYFSQTGQFVSKEASTIQTSVSQKLGSGADLSLGLQSTQQDNNGTLYTSRLSLDITQPLLNGFGQIPTDISIMTAQLAAEKSRYDYTATVASTLQSALSTYADYVVAWQKQKIYDDDLKLAQYLVSQIKRKNTLELVDTVALLDAEIQLATVEDAKRSAAHDQMTLLATLTHISGTLWQPRPSHQVSLPEPLPLTDAIATAMAQNPTLIAAKIAIETQAVTVQFLENQTLPVIDLNGSLGYNKSGSAWQDSVQFQDPSFVVGLSGSLPWGNRESTAQAADAKLTLQDLQLQYQQQQETLAQDIENAYRDVSLKETRLTHYQNIQRLADKKLALEKKKFELGLSLADTLLEAQKYKTNAAIQSASAELDYIRACLLRDGLLGRMAEWVTPSPNTGT